MRNADPTIFLSQVPGRDEERVGVDDGAVGAHGEYLVAAGVGAWVGHLPGSSVDFSNVRADRRWSHETRLHLVRQVLDGEGFDLHKKCVARSWKNSLDGEVEAVAPGEEARDGGRTHIHFAASIARRTSAGSPALDFPLRLTGPSSAGPRLPSSQR